LSLSIFKPRRAVDLVAAYHVTYGHIDLSFFPMSHSRTVPVALVKKPHATPGDAEYVLGTGIEESVRLGLQHRLWSSSAHDLWERAGIQPGMTVLDVGCGPGHASMDMAQIVGPGGKIIAIDESVVFLKQLNEQAKARKLTNIDRVLGDVQNLDKAIPGNDGLIDMAYARWVFCFLARPEDVINGLARLLKQFGVVAIQDYFSYESMTMAPRRDIFTKVVKAIAQSWRDQGGDPDIAARLPGMLRKNGFKVKHIAASERIARPGSTMWHWPASFWSTFLPRLEKLGYITSAEHEEFMAMWTAAGEDKDCFVMLPPVFDLIAIKT